MPLPHALKLLPLLPALDTCSPSEMLPPNFCAWSCSNCSASHSPVSMPCQNQSIPMHNTPLLPALCIQGTHCSQVSHPPPPLTPRILQHPAYLIPQKAFGTFANINTYVYTCIHVNNIKIYIFAYIHTLHCITLHYITLHYIIYIRYITYITYITCMHAYIHTLHYITLHYIALHYITPHHITLHYIHK